MYRWLSALLCLALIAVVPAGSASAAVQDTHVRFLHAAPGVRDVDVQVDGKPLLKGFAFQSVSDYAPLASGKHKVELFPAGNKNNPILSEEFELEPGMAVTAAIAGQGEDVQVQLYPDKMSGRDGKATLRLIHLSPNAPKVDLSTAAGKVLFSGVGMFEASPYKEIRSGALNFVINPSGNPEAPTVSEVAVDLEPGKVYSAVLTGMAGTAPSLEVLLLEDGVVPGLPKSGMGGASPIVE